MPKIVRSAVFLSATLALAGCELFFGDDPPNLPPPGQHRNPDTPEPPPAPVNSPPSFTSANAISVDAGRTATGYTATATDPDGDTLSFATSGGADEAAFEIDAATGALSFLVAPDFAAPHDANADNIYEVQLTVSDTGAETDTLDLAVTVVEAGLYIELTYPTPNANLGGAVTMTTVTGNVVDPLGQAIAPADIGFIDVNGTLATLDQGDPSRWSVQVPVVEGDNVLAVTFERSGGVSTTTNFALRNVVVHPGFRDIVLDAAIGVAYVVENFNNRLLGVDVASGEISIVSDAANGTGTNFNSPRNMALDSANGRVLIADWQRDALVAVNLATGDRTDISSPSVGAGIAIDGAQSVALDSAGNRALVIATNVDALIAVDLATGDRTEFSGPSVGAGPAIPDPRDITVDAANNRALVADSDVGAIYSVSLVNGDRAIVSDDVTGTGQDLSSPESIALDSANNRLLVAELTGFLLAVDLATGDRSLIAETRTDFGLNSTRFDGVALDGANGRALVSDSTVDAIFSFDLTSGDRTVVADNAVGTGPHLTNLFGTSGIGVDPIGNRILVPNRNALALVGVDLASGDRSFLSSDGTTAPAAGSGPGVIGPQRLDIDADSNRAFLPVSGNSVLAIDLVTGDRTIVSGGATGSGPAFATPLDVAVDPANDRLLVLDTAGLVSVDIATGDRTLVSGGATGGGPLLTQPAAVTLDAANDRALLIDFVDDTLMAIDLATGDRSLLSDNAGLGAGTNFNIPFDLDFDADNNRVLVTDYGVDALIAVDLVSGDRTIVSGAAAGSGVSFLNPYYVDLDLNNNRAFVFDIAVTAILVIELSTGERAVISK